MMEDPELAPYMRLPDITSAPQPGGTVTGLYDSLAWWNHVVCGAGRSQVVKVAGQPDRRQYVSTQFGKENERRNIVLSLSHDGFLPYDHGQYSMTHITAMVLNLPENLRHKHSHLMIVGIIPGPKGPTKFNAYMKLIVDELKDLWHHGFEYTDPISSQAALSKVKLLYCSADYPAHCKANYQQQHSGKSGCIKCEIQVRSQH